MDTIIDLAKENQRRAFEVIETTDIISIWNSAGCEINLVGSLKTGLLVKHRDIDFHIYSTPLYIHKSFSAMSKLALNSHITHIEYTNLIDTDEVCIEWHAWYKDDYSDIWQIDMIHMLKGSRYDGFFEKVAERINAVATKEQKETIMKLKYETPDMEKIMGIEYYMAVIRDRINNYQDFLEWRKNYSPQEGMKWLP